jgi:hypothetical protein
LASCVATVARCASAVTCASGPNVSKWLRSTARRSGSPPKFSLILRPARSPSTPSSRAAKSCTLLARVRISDWPMLQRRAASANFPSSVLLRTKQMILATLLTDASTASEIAAAKFGSDTESPLGSSSLFILYATTRTSYHVYTPARRGKRPQMRPCGLCKATPGTPSFRIGMTPTNCGSDNP